VCDGVGVCVGAYILVIGYLHSSLIHAKASRECK